MSGAHRYEACSGLKRDIFTVDSFERVQIVQTKRRRSKRTIDVVPRPRTILNLFFLFVFKGNDNCICKVVVGIMKLKQKVKQKL